jgi:flavin reductase (DIM6/NTAB) family NADH-FMN oxidoreductase RutF
VVETVTELNSFVELNLDAPIWDRVFTVAPLVVVGTREADGTYDLVPKHLALPLGWDRYFGFVTRDNQTTHRNVKRERCFTVSFPNPSSVVLTSLAAVHGSEEHRRTVLNAVPTIKAVTLDGLLVADSYLFLECELDRIVGGFGNNSLVCGLIRRAAVSKESLRLFEQDDQVMLQRRPLLAFLAPERYAILNTIRRFPVPNGIRT